MSIWSPARPLGSFTPSQGVLEALRRVPALVARAILGLLAMVFLAIMACAVTVFSVVGWLFRSGKGL